MRRVFDWDPRKAAANVVRHGLAFEAAVELFTDPNVYELDTTRPEDGERRAKAIGMIEDRLFIIIFTLRDGTTRVISARRANRREERLYGDRSLHA